MRHRHRAAIVCGAFAVLGCAVLMACTDGVTPDCSDAATHCGPDVDGSSDASEAALPDSSRPDAALDAPSEALADADAGDGD
jgi:hypothetical protein